MNVNAFRQGLLEHLEEFGSALTTDAGDWAVKGFIDVYRNIYTISRDTKVVSKIIELMLLPVFSRFAKEHSCKMLLSEYQNFCPDISFIGANIKRCGNWWREVKRWRTLPAKENTP